MSSIWLHIHLIFNVISQNIIPFSCITRNGPKIGGIAQKSQVSCQSTEILVSCGIIGSQDIGGTWIENSTCIALSNHDPSTITASARCCIFPSNIITSASITSSTSATQSIATSCPSNSALTGCQVYYSSGSYNQIQGSFAGPNLSTPQTASWISTNNQCNARSYPSGTVMGQATCIYLNEGYLLECKTKALFTNLLGFGGCDTNYIMTACGTYTDSRSLDDYHITTDNICYVQQDGDQNMYANAICCRLLAIMPTYTVPFTCITRTGPTITGIGQKSQISCQNGETLVSCGIFGHADIGGTWLENGTCIALSHHDQHQVSAKARCCTFPSGAIASVSIKSSISNGTSVSSTCSVGSVLTGCQVYYASGAYNQIQGSFAGPNTSTPQTSSWISTDNQCNARSYDTGSVMSMATCLTVNYGYLLECKTNAKFTNFNNFGQCEAGYIMIACNTYTETDSLDKYYINDDNECFVQQDYDVNMYANAICCRLLSSMTSNPTAYPTADPTTNPTNDPTIDPSINPTSNPSTNPTINPSTNPSLFPSNPTINPTSNPTTNPTIDPTVDPTTNPTKAASTNPTTTTQPNDIQVETTRYNTDELYTSMDANRSGESNGLQSSIIAILIGICGLLVCFVIILIIIMYKIRKREPAIIKHETVDEKSTSYNQTNQMHGHHKSTADIEDMFNAGNNKVLMETPMGCNIINVETIKTTETPGDFMHEENGENAKNVDQETLPNNEDEQSGSSDDMFEQGVDTTGNVQMTTVR